MIFGPICEICSNTEKYVLSFINVFCYMYPLHVPHICDMVDSRCLMLYVPCFLFYAIFSIEYKLLLLYVTIVDSRCLMLYVTCFLFYAIFSVEYKLLLLCVINYVLGVCAMDTISAENIINTSQ